jgi:hypothetical protein
MSHCTTAVEGIKLLQWKKSDQNKNIRKRKLDLNKNFCKKSQKRYVGIEEDEDRKL